jgi:hypothetical protein
MENQKLVVTRSEYSFLVWLAMLGGIQKIVRSYFHFLTDAVSKKFFLNSILGDIFFIKEVAAH